MLKKIFGKLFEKLLKLPGCCAAAVIFGAIGGYPSGAILTEHLYNQGQIDSSTAARIMSFNFGGGIAFLITAVGTMRYNNTKIGVAFFAVSSISSLIICAASAFVNGKAPDNSTVMKNSLCFTDALVESVEAATKSIINMSAYIILFSAIARAFKINDFFAPLMLFYMKHCNYEKPKLIKVGMGHSRNESKEELAYAKDMFETIFKDYTKEKDVHISGLLADLMKQTPVTETDFRMLKGKILLILPDQDFFSGKMQKDLIQLMHDPVIQYVSGGHLSTILKADDYVKVIRDFLGNI